MSSNRGLKKSSPRNKLQIAVFCSGFGSNLEALLRAEKKGTLKADVAAIVSDNPECFALERARRYRKQAFLFMPQHYNSRQAYEEIIVRFLRQKKVGLVALAGFMRILTPYFVRAFAGKILNIHPSLLPQFKGARAIRDAFEANAGVTGATVHFVTDALDAGPVVLQKEVRRLPRDTRETLERRIHRAEHQIYPQAVKLFAEGKIKSAKGKNGIR